MDKVQVIRLKLIVKNSESRIGVKFFYNKEVIEILKIFSLTVWSKTFTMWHMPYSESVIVAFYNLAKKHSWQIILEGDELKSIVAQIQKKSVEHRSKERRIDARNEPVKKKPFHRTFGVIKEENLGKITFFQKYMEQRRYSLSTIESYVTRLKLFFRFYDEKPWTEITLNDIESYNYEEYIVNGSSTSSQNQFISAIKLFFTFFKREEIIPDEILRPNRQKYLPNVLTKEEVKNIILSCGNIKHRCILSITYGAGLRIGEVLNLRLEDVRRDERLLYIKQGKGSKDRRVPLSDPMFKMIEEYWLSYRPKKYLFEGGVSRKYSYSSVQKVMKRAAKKAGIKIRVTLHTLRHSYATHLLESGVGLRYIQELLGHNSPKTTMIYTHVSGKKLNEVKSPFDDLNI